MFDCGIFTKGINSHYGGHPRKGIIDLIPIHPITENTTLEDCAGVAIRVSQNLTRTKVEKSGERIQQDVDTFLFGHADIPLRRSLVTMRKNVKWYSSEIRGNQCRFYIFFLSDNLSNRYVTNLVSYL